MLRLFTDIGDVAIWADGALCLAFLVQYWLMEPWWRNPVGITMWGLTACMLIIIAPSLLALADPAFTGFGTSLWYRWLAIGIVLAVLAFMTTRVITWELVRRRAGRLRKRQAAASAPARETERQASE